MEDMIDKIVIDIDTSQISTAQAKLDKLKKTLEQINNIKIDFKGFENFSKSYSNFSNKTKKTADDIKNSFEKINEAEYSNWNPFDIFRNQDNGQSKSSSFSEFFKTLNEIGVKATDVGGKLGGSLGKALTKVGGKFTSVAQAGSMFGLVLMLISGWCKLVGKTLKTVVKAVAELAKALKQKIKDNFILKILNRLAKTAFSRLLRQITVELGKGFTEGINNLVKESARFKSAMDSLASTSLYVKNSVAAMVAPIITSLAPAISYVADLFVRATNAIGMFFAVLGGAGVFTKAKKKMVEYGDAVGGAGGKAKKLKDYLLDIDELHVLNDNNSGGGGGGGSSLDTSDMFETIKIPEWLSDMVSADTWFGLGLTVGHKINETLKNIKWDKIKRTIDGWATKLTSFVNGAMRGLNWKLIGKTLADGLNVAVGFLSSFVTEINWTELGENIGSSLNSAISHIDWENLGTVLGGKFIIALNMLHGFMKKFSWGLLTSTLQEMIKAMFKNVNLREVAIDVSDVVKNTLTLLTILIRELDTDKIVEALVSIRWASIFEEASELTWAVLSKVIMAALYAAFDAICEMIGYIFSFDFIVDMFEGIVYTIRDLFLGMVGLIKGNLPIYVDMEFPTLSKIKQMAQDIYDAIKSPFKKPIKIEFKVPKLSFSVAATGLSTALKGFKTFASGGFVDMGQMFIAREAGPELVGTIGNQTAVANNKQIVESVSVGVSNAVSGVLSNYVPQIVSAIMDRGNMTIQVDGKAFGVVARDSINGLVPIYGETGLMW